MSGRKEVAHNLVTFSLATKPTERCRSRCKTAVMPPGNGLLCALTTHTVSKSVSGPGWRTFALRFCDHCFYFIIMFSSWKH